MPATRLPLVSPLARPPSTLLRTSFDRSFRTLLCSYSGLLTVRPAANAMPSLATPGMLSDAPATTSPLDDGESLFHDQAHTSSTQNMISGCKACTRRTRRVFVKEDKLCYHQRSAGLALCEGRRETLRTAYRIGDMA
jgi:hypothetical protein